MPGAVGSTCSTSFFSEEDRLNHSTLDFNAKLSYDISPSSSLKALAYHAQDIYRMPVGPKEKITAMRWNNQIYQLAYNFSKGKLSNTTSLFYTSHENVAHAGILGFETATRSYIHSGIKSMNVSTEFTYSYDNIYTTRWGAKYAHEVYDLAILGDTVRVRHEPIDQFSIFYDNLIRITSQLFTQVGVHFIGYLPEKHRDYYSIQPRFSLKYSPWTNDLFYLNFSRMEQFYHYLRFNTFYMPTDFRMPSIESYKPRSSEHYEAGWKHNLRNGALELSAYYKTRRNIVALRPETFVEDTEWGNYIMTGNGDSYGIKCYFYNYWRHWLLQLSYTYARSREWFDELKANGKIPSLYDIPHQLERSRHLQPQQQLLLLVGRTVEVGQDTRNRRDNFRPLPHRAVPHPAGSAQLPGRRRLFVQEKFRGRQIAAASRRTLQHRGQPARRGVARLLLRALALQLHALREHQLQVLNRQKNSAPGLGLKSKESHKPVTAQNSPCGEGKSRCDRLPKLVLAGVVFKTRTAQLGHQVGLADVHVVAQRIERGIVVAQLGVDKRKQDHRIFG